MGSFDRLARPKNVPFSLLRLAGPAEDAIAKAYGVSPSTASDMLNKYGYADAAASANAHPSGSTGDPFGDAFNAIGDFVTGVTKEGQQATQAAAPALSSAAQAVSSAASAPAAAAASGSGFFDRVPLTAVILGTAGLGLVATGLFGLMRRG